MKNSRPLALIFITCSAVALTSCRGGSKTSGTANPSGKPAAKSPASKSGTPSQSGTKRGRLEQSMVVDGKKRGWVLHVPQSYDGSKAVPLVFMFHGSGGDGDRFYRKSGWVKLSDKEGFIAVFPSALKHCVVDPKRKTLSKWNDGKLASYVCKGQELSDDVEFVRELLARLKKEYKVDADRVFVSGFSNGAGFTWRLAMEMSEQFAAAAPGSGGPQVTTKPKRPIPVYQIAGSKESEDKFGMGKITGDPVAIMNSPVGDRVKRSLDLLELTDDYEFVKNKKSMTLKFTKSKVGGDNVYHVALIRGMGHVYPNGNNHPFKASERFWAFFKGKR